MKKENLDRTEKSKSGNETRKPLSRKEFIIATGTLAAGTVYLAACDGVSVVRAVENMFATVTPIPSPDAKVENTNTPTPSKTPTPKREPSPSSTPTETSTPTPSSLGPEVVANKSDKEIFNIIGIPNPKDYLLNEKLSPNKILRNEGGSSYALFQNPEGIPILAENLDTRVTEHAIYTEYEKGVPLMILTDQAVVEKDNGWFKLNEDYPASDAQARLAEAFNRGLSFTWWAANHPKEHRSTKMYSLNEIPGFQGTDRDFMARSKRRKVSDYILQSFKGAVETAREDGSPLVLNFPDRNKAKFDAAKDTLIMKPILNVGVVPNWPEVGDGMGYNKDIRNVTSERDGSLVYLYIKQPAFMPSRDVFSPIGGFMTAFLRYFFGSDYYQYSDTYWVYGAHYDLTGSILENMCRDGSIPDSILNHFSLIYPSFDYPNAPTNSCAVKFGK